MQNNCYFSAVTFKQNGLASLIVMISLGFVSCARKPAKPNQVTQVSVSGFEQVTQDQIPTAEPSPGPSPQIVIPVPSKMVGTWVKSCKPVADEDEETGSYSVYEELTIGTGGELSILRTYYAGTKCKNRKMIQRLRLEGIITLTADFIKANDNAKAKVTYWDQEAIDQANEAKTCGKADWRYAYEHDDCLSQQGESVLNAQYSVENSELAIFACETDDLNECASDVYWLAK